MGLGSWDLTLDQSTSPSPFIQTETRHQHSTQHLPSPGGPGDKGCQQDWPLGSSKLSPDPELGGDVLTHLRTPSTHTGSHPGLEAAQKLLPGFFSLLSLAQTLPVKKQKSALIIGNLPTVLPKQRGCSHVHVCPSGPCRETPDLDEPAWTNQEGPVGPPTSGDQLMRTVMLVLPAYNQLSINAFVMEQR